MYFNLRTFLITERGSRGIGMVSLSQGKGGPFPHNPEIFLPWLPEVSEPKDFSPAAFEVS